MSVATPISSLALRLANLPRWAIIFLGLILLLLAGVIDWVTGPEIAISVIYLVPITLMTWRVGRMQGLVTAVMSGCIWLFIELMTNNTYTNPLIPFWNSVVRTTVFCLVWGLAAEIVRRRNVEQALRQSQEELELRVRERTGELQALNATLELRVAERAAEAEVRAAKLAKSEADLQKQTGILQSVLDSMGDGVVVADSQGGLLLMNPAARKVLRFPAQSAGVQEWIRSWQMNEAGLVVGRARQDNALMQGIRGEAVDGVEMCLRDDRFPEGVWLAVTGRPLLDAAGKTAGGVVVFSDITARRDMERQMAEVSDREQRRIGEDLHDGLCQQLVSVAFAARTLAAQLADRSLPETEAASEIAELLGESISQARDVARGLYLVPLEAGGLHSALEDLARQVRSQHKVQCEFVDRALIVIEGEAMVTSLFRIAQEAVKNAVKHAHASRILITLFADESQVSLSVEDNGRGVLADIHGSRGMGFHIMNHRSRMIGGAFNITSRSDGGTVVTCLIRHWNPVDATTHLQQNS